MCIFMPDIGLVRKSHTLSRDLIIAVSRAWSQDLGFPYSGRFMTLLAARRPRSPQDMTKVRLKAEGSQ